MPYPVIRLRPDCLLAYKNIGLLDQLLSSQCVIKPIVRYRRDAEARLHANSTRASPRVDVPEGSV
jgi:hypothetical protein